MGSAGAALTGTDAGAAERRVEDAAFGLRWLEIAHGRRFDLKKPLARELPLEWLNEPRAAATGGRAEQGAD